MINVRIAAAACLALLPSALAQTPTPLASELVESLAQSPGAGWPERLTSGCGLNDDAVRAHGTAMALVRLGASALPAVEKAETSIERSGLESRYGANAGLLLNVYATIAGRTSYRRLAALSADPRFSSLGLNELIAVSLGLTSYVVSSKPLGYSVTCGTSTEPRNALNLFILAWEKRSRAWLEASLGPSGRAALAGLVKKGSRYGVLAPNSSAGTISDVAIGYRFMISDRWAEPALRLRDNQISGTVVSSGLNPEIETVFTNRSGDVCGSYRLKFTNTTGTGPLAYVIENTDLEPLFRTLEECATRVGK